MSRPDFLAVTAVSHDGMLRDHNEDGLLVGPWTTCAVSTQSPQTLVFPLGSDPVVVAVADGLGGRPAGEPASSVVVESLARISGLLRDEQTVRQAIRGCNEAVFDQASLDPHAPRWARRWPEWSSRAKRSGCSTSVTAGCMPCRVPA